MYFKSFLKIKWELIVPGAQGPGRPRCQWSLPRCHLPLGHREPPQPCPPGEKGTWWEPGGRRMSPRWPGRPYRVGAGDLHGVGDAVGRVAGLGGPPRLRHGLRGPRHGAGRPDELPLSGQSSSSAGGRPRHRRLRETRNEVGSANGTPSFGPVRKRGKAGPSLLLLHLPPCPLGPGGAQSHRLGQQLPHKPRQGVVATPLPRPPLSRRRTHHVATNPPWPPDLWGPVLRKRLAAHGKQAGPSGEALGVWWMDTVRSGRRRAE